MDVYFERIAGVADPRQESEPAPPPSVAPSREKALDENGFPLSPLQDQDQLWFVQAARLHLPLAKAAATARASSLSLMIAGAFTVLTGGLQLAHGGSPVSVVLGLLLITLGSMERAGAADLAAAVAGAPGKLARNQMILFVLIAAATWSSGLGEMSLPDAKAMSQLPPELARTVTSMMSQGLLVPVLGMLLLIQGSLALYYLSRRGRIAEFHSELPPWVARVVTTVARR